MFLIFFRIKMISLKIFTIEFFLRLNIFFTNDSSQIYYVHSYWKFTSIHIAVIKSAKSHDPIITQST